MSSVFAHGSSTIDNYLFALKNYDYLKAESIAEEFKNERLRIVTSNLANVLYYSGQGQIRLENLDGNDQLLIRVFVMLSKGYSLLYTNAYSPKPFQIFNEALKLSRELGNHELIKFCILSVIQVYNFEISQSNDNARLFLDEYKKMISDNTDSYHYNISLLLFNLRDIFFEIDLDTRFIKDFSQLMSKFHEEHKFWPIYYSTMGVLYESRNNYEKATNFHKKAIQLIKNEPFLRYIIFRSSIRLSQIMKEKKKLNRALDYLVDARKYMDKSDSTRSQYYLDLYSSEIHYMLGDYKKAFVKLDTAFNAGNILDYRKNSIEIARLNVKYRTQEKEIQLMQIRQRTKESTAIAVVLAVILFFAALTFFLLQKNTSKKRQLAEQEVQLKQQRVENLLKEQELVSIDAMIAGQEKERQKVAGELHDDLGSLMATIKLHFDNVKVEKKDSALKNAQKLLEEAYQKVRSMAHSKNSGVMSDQGLLPTIKKMAKTITETNALEVTVEDFGFGERMENSLELTIFRVVQELVTNAIKHSEATLVNIQMTQHKDNLNIIVEDNGKGFDWTKLDLTKSGMGLTNIEKRVEHLEGNFTVDSVLGKGTSILIDIPI